MGLFRKRNESSTEKYLRLMDEGNAREALAVIEEIVAQNPSISTSQFNYGICLTQLGRHRDAATAFLKAYELNSEDGGALCRACYALARANDPDRLHQVFTTELERDPDMINIFIEEEAFAPFFAEDRFFHLKDQYADYIRPAT